jgi:flagellar motor switch protein FliG
MEREKAAALRRVAIVLSSLPDATARRLLATLDIDHQRAVRNAIHHLEDVDPLERRRALDGFTASIRSGRSSLAGQNEAAEVVLSAAALHHDHARSNARSQAIAIADGGNADHGNPASGSLAFKFLESIDDDAIAHRVKDEHPQTVAIILASISPRQAARLLGKLNAALRSETMRRLAKMDTPPGEVAEEIAAQLKQKLVHQQASGVDFTPNASTHEQAAGVPLGQRRTVGQAALQSILAELNQTSSGRAASPTAGWRSNDSAKQSTIPIAGGTVDCVTAPTQSDMSSKNDTRFGHVSNNATEIHTQLISLTPAQLRQALASVDARQAILALCGLPKATADAVLNDLPRRQAKQIRQQIASLGMLELREIDAAKEAVAKAIRPAQNPWPKRSVPDSATPTSTSLAAA